MNEIFNKHNQGVKVISRAAHIMRILAKNTAGLSLGGISREASLPRSTVQRIVATLADEGLVSIGKTNGGIRLGPEIQTLARAVITSPRDRFRPILETIAKDTGETVDLAVLRADKMLFIDQVVGGQRLRTVSSIGESFPLTSTANGKAALACLEEFDAARLIMEEMSGNDSKDRNLPDLLAEVAAIRNGALACDNGEHTDGISALGFALADPNGDVHAISLPVPSSRFESKKKSLFLAMSKAKELMNSDSD